VPPRLYSVLFARLLPCRRGDLAVALALVSSFKDCIVPDDLIAVGELGLAGECRAVANLEQRIREAARLGFTKAIIPFRNIEKRKITVPGIELIPIRGIYEALPHLKKSESAASSSDT